MQKPAQTTGSRSAGKPFFGQDGPATTVPPTQATTAAAQAPPSSGRSAGKPFFGQEGPAPTIPPTQASTAAAQAPPSSGRAAGTPFFGQSAPTQGQVSPFASKPGSGDVSQPGTSDLPPKSDRPTDKGNLDAFDADRAGQQASSAVRSAADQLQQGTQGAAGTADSGFSRLADQVRTIAHIFTVAAVQQDAVGSPCRVQMWQQEWGMARR